MYHSSVSNFKLNGVAFASGTQIAVATADNFSRVVTYSYGGFDLTFTITKAAGNNLSGFTVTAVSATVPSNHVTGFTASVSSPQAISNTWADATGTTLPDGYLVMCNKTGTFADPSDGTAQSNDTNCGDGAGVQNTAQGTQTASWAGLDPNTQYFFKIFPYKGSGALINYKTDGSVPTASATTIAVGQRTQRIISNFMARRADQIVSNDPDLTNRLSNGNGSGNGGPVAFTGQGAGQSNNFTFATSMRQILASNQGGKDQRRNELSPTMALGVHSASGYQTPSSGFDIWVKGKWSKIDNDTVENKVGLLYLGADYRFGSHLAVGLIGQFDWTDEKDDAQNFKIDGKGWMAGPYMVARLHQNLIFDGRAAWGKSDNDVSPFNTYTDSFDGQRWLVKGQFTGDFRIGAMHLAPHIGMIYFEEKQKAYTDSLGNTIGSQTVNLGRLTFGPKVSTTYQRKDGTAIVPFVALKGLWDFKHTDIVNISTGLAAGGNDKLRGRTEAGLSIITPDGISLTGEGFYDGIGADDYEAYGGGVRLAVPF